MDLLTNQNMLNVKPISTPLSSSPKLTLTSRQPLDDPSQYRTIIGSLQYLVFTRQDIAYAVNHFLQFMHCPTLDH